MIGAPRFGSYPEVNRRSFVAQAAAGLLTLPWLAGCMGHTAAGPVAAPPAVDLTGNNSLGGRAASKGFLAGCAVDVSLLARDASYRDLVISQARIIVAENSMKWGRMRPTIDTYDFVEADQFVSFGEEHRMKLRGHNLCWHRQLPRWFAAEATAANASGLLTAHIEKVAGRYAGRMHSWDVVNEAVSVEDGRADGLRVSPWLKLAGDDYIELAFRTARDADPQALLTYNDYGIEGEDQGSAKKRAAVLELLRRLKTRGVPLDALGIQSHIQCGRTYGAGLTELIAQARGLGLEVFLTEMDVNDRELPADVATRDHAVAALYGSYLALTLASPAVRAVLTWGITDRRTWLNGEDARPDHLPERCLPFGELAGKPDQPTDAFFAMRTAFNGRRSA